MCQNRLYAQFCIDVYRLIIYKYVVYLQLSMRVYSPVSRSLAIIELGGTLGVT